MSTKLARLSWGGADQAATQHAMSTLASPTGCLARTHSKGVDAVGQDVPAGDSAGFPVLRHERRKLPVCPGHDQKRQAARRHVIEHLQRVEGDPPGLEELFGEHQAHGIGHEGRELVDHADQDKLQLAVARYGHAQGDDHDGAEQRQVEAQDARGHADEESHRGQSGLDHLHEADGQVDVGALAAGETYAEEERDGHNTSSVIRPGHVHGGAHAEAYENRAREGAEGHVAQHQGHGELEAQARATVEDELVVHHH